MTWPDRPALPVSVEHEPVGPSLDWAREELTAAGYRVDAAAPDVRRRPWAIVARLDTDRGPVWVKAGARAFGVEAGLLALLTRYAPAHVAVPVATDPARNRSITLDAGPTLAAAGTPADGDRAALLAGYADLQRRLAARPAELRSIGLPDLSPSRLTAWHRAVLDRVDAEPAITGLLPPGARADLEALLPTTAALAAELGDDGLPPTVEHLDLHDGNVGVGADGTLRLFDWGDAVLAHPFHCLGTPLARDPAAREAYLWRWSGGGAVAAVGGRGLGDRTAGGGGRPTADAAGREARLEPGPRRAAAGLPAPSARGAGRRPGVTLITGRAGPSAGARFVPSVPRRVPGWQP